MSKEYLAEHKPGNQETINGVIVNPNLRSGFDNTPNEERDPEEWDDWNGVFYVVGADDDLESQMPRWWGMG